MKNVNQNSHPSQTKLLGYRLDLLDQDEMVAIKKHLDVCVQCQNTLENAESELDATSQTPSQTEPQKPPFSRFFYSSAIPALIMALSIALSMVFDWFVQTAGFVPLIVGSILVVFWLHSVVARFERDWRQVTDKDWMDEFDSDEDRSRTLEGIRLSALQALRESRNKVNFAFILAAVIFILSGAVTLGASAWYPDLTVSVASQKPLLLPGGLAFGVLAAGVFWVSFRLSLLARRISVFIRESANSIKMTPLA